MTTSACKQKPTLGASQERLCGTSQDAEEDWKSGAARDGKRAPNDLARPPGCSINVKPRCILFLTVMTLSFRTSPKQFVRQSLTCGRKGLLNAGKLLRCMETTEQWEAGANSPTACQTLSEQIVARQERIVLGDGGGGHEAFMSLCSVHWRSR